MTAHISSLIMAICPHPTKTIQCSSIIILFTSNWCTLCRFSGEFEGLRGA